jgi:streptogramin lyase
MATKLRGARSARRVLSVIAGTVAVVLVATAAPADASVTIDEFGTPFSNSSPGGITVGPDGNVWFTEVQGGGDGLGSITPNRTGVPTFGNDDYGGTSSRIANVTTGPDGNLWFTENSIFEIGQITTNGVITQFSAGQCGSRSRSPRWWALPAPTSRGPRGTLRPGPASTCSSSRPVAATGSPGSPG